MPDAGRTQRRFWSSLESLSKIAAGFGAAVGAILIPFAITSYTEESNRAQVYMQVMTEREKKDTEIREKMFEALIKDYLGSLTGSSRKEPDYGLSLRRDLVLLELLTTNFQEFFDTAPIAEDIHERLVRFQETAKTRADKREAQELESKLIRVATELASRQSARINTFGTSAFVNLGMGESVCVRLYSRGELDELYMPDGSSRIEPVSPEPCARTLKEQRLTAVLSARHEGHSLEIRLSSVTRTAVQVQVNVYADEFRGGRLIGSVLQHAIPPFNVSYFDLPYLDNTKLADGSRFALVLRNLVAYEDSMGKQQQEAELEVLRFRRSFVTLRDRPEFEEMLKQLAVKTE